eukprot:jgi/Bigna1/89733/estExt_fgenesh1_pg.C_540109
MSFPPKDLKFWFRIERNKPTTVMDDRTQSHSLCSCQSITYVGLAIYVASTAAVVYSLFNPPDCDPATTAKCFKPPGYIKKPMDLHIWVGDSWCTSDHCIDLASKSNLNFTNISISESHTWEIPHLKIPKSSRNNGSVCMTAILGKRGFTSKDIKNPKKAGKMVRTDIYLTKHLPIMTYTARNLLGSKNETEEGKQAEQSIVYGEVVTHWKGRVKLRVVTPKAKLLKDPQKTPDLWRWPTHKKHWLPHFYADESTLFRSHYSRLSNNTNKEDPPIKIELLPTSLGAYRLLTTVHTGVNQMKNMGFSEADIEEVMYMLAPERLFRMMLTWIVSMLHMLFSALAFKNEVGFWSGRETVAGLSQSAVIGQAICSIIILLFLFDSDHTSRVIDDDDGGDGGGGGIGYGSDVNADRFMEGEQSVEGSMELDKNYIDDDNNTIIEKLRIFTTTKCLPKLAASTTNESKTREFDVQGIRYLSLALVPLILVAKEFATQTSNILRMCNVLELYADGRYKAFNTFVDDAFAWIIEMPTAHRLATLRDDLVFFVYIYQRFLYPVDKTRPNEFGFAYEADAAAKKEEDSKDKDDAGGDKDDGRLRGQEVKEEKDEKSVQRDPAADDASAATTVENTAAEVATESTSGDNGHNGELIPPQSQNEKEGPARNRAMQRVHARSHEHELSLWDAQDAHQCFKQAPANEMNAVPMLDSKGSSSSDVRRWTQLEMKEHQKTPRILPLRQLFSGDKSGWFWNAPELRSPVPKQGRFTPKATEMCLEMCLEMLPKKPGTHPESPEQKTTLQGAPPSHIPHHQNSKSQTTNSNLTLMMFHDYHHPAAMYLLRPGFRRPSYALTDPRDFYRAADFEEAFESMSRDMRRLRLQHEQLLTRSPMTRSERKKQKIVEIPISREIPIAKDSAPTSEAKKMTDASNKREEKAPADAMAEKSMSRNKGYKDIFSNKFSEDWITGLPSSSLPLLQKNEEADRYIYTLDKAIGDIKCSVRDNNLHIEGTKEKIYDNGYYKESFTRSFSLPANIETDKMKAELLDGKLSINIPKSTPSKIEKEETKKANSTSSKIEKEETKEEETTRN